MRFWLSLVSVRESQQWPEIARLAEDLGFHGLMVGDHLLWPAYIETPYPYSPDGKLFVPQDTPWPDPWVLFAHLGAITRKLQFASNIYLAALRDPFTAAKAVATAALLTQGRIICGVSAGWLAEEYEMVGVDFAARGRRLDEVLAVMRKLWSGRVVEHRGEFFRFEGISCPAPPRPIPIWCGGDAPSALRRAARNDGWLPLPMTVAQAQRAVTKLIALREAEGRAPDTLRVGLPIAEPLTRALLDDLRGAGLDDIVVIAPWLPSPWDVESFVDAGADTSQLAVKKQALERCARRLMR
ncbi:MAG TPA: TIGR03619 family F420-dependent LLM class oxidoreductase [Steroidobacteraceae bacterium]|nr:TIGR03619 family F420-dependent LLM class oxidoreductase [Steroidobacteraceae bacterium]